MSRGDVTNIKTDRSVNCNNVLGNIEAGGSVNCDDVGGDINAGGSVNCDDVKGSVIAKGSWYWYTIAINTYPIHKNQLLLYKYETDHNNLYYLLYFEHVL